MYYRTFASQYIAFRERDSMLLRNPLEMEEIRAYAEAHDISRIVCDVDGLLNELERGLHGLMWERAYRAPHRMADIYNQRILVIIDEF